MIKITKTEVYGWEAAIRGMRNPLNSREKSDSVFFDDNEGQICTINNSCLDAPVFVELGDNDLSLMRKLSDAGSDHGKFLRMITVTADINAPLYWWKGYSTYKVATVANSCSTMHKIHAKEFTLDDFSHEHLSALSKEYLMSVIFRLNEARENYIVSKEKAEWWQMIQLLPSSYNQLRTVQLNYQVLKNMYHARKTHKLDEWHDFCKWIETLPYSELITGEG